MPTALIANGVWENLYRCPRRPIFEDPQFYNGLFNAYGFWQKGIFPEDGALRSQPAKLVICIQIIESEVAGLRAQKEQEHQREVTKRARQSGGSSTGTPFPYAKKPRKRRR